MQALTQLAPVRHGFQINSTGAGIRHQRKFIDRRKESDERLWQVEKRARKNKS